MVLDTKGVVRLHAGVLHPHQREPARTFQDRTASRDSGHDRSPDPAVGSTTRLRHRANDPLTSKDVLQVDTGSLYPALHRLEKQGWIVAEWGLSGNKQRVRTYQLTEAGRGRLVAEQSRWDQLSEAIALIMRAPRESAT